MFSYLFMKLLEQRPRSYDERMNRISRGAVRAVKRAVAAEIPPGASVVEVGCGTGELAEMLVSQGATVIGFDLSDSMLAVAREKIAARSLEEHATFRHMGVEAMDQLSGTSFDAVLSTLTFSELTDDERRFALRHALRVLKPGGCLVIADEVVPRSKWRRVLQSLVLVPALIATYLVSRSSVRPLADLAGEVASAGFTIQKETRSDRGSFAILVAHRPLEEARA